MFTLFFCLVSEYIEINEYLSAIVLLIVSLQDFALIRCMNKEGNNG